MSHRPPSPNALAAAPGGRAAGSVFPAGAGPAPRASAAPARTGPALPQPQRQADRAALEPEFLAQPALEEAAVARLQETRGEQHEMRRPDACLGREHDPRLPAAPGR